MPGGPTGLASRRRHSWACRSSRSRRSSTFRSSSLRDCPSHRSGRI